MKRLEFLSSSSCLCVNQPLWCSLIKKDVSVLFLEPAHLNRIYCTLTNLLGLIYFYIPCLESYRRWCNEIPRVIISLDLSFKCNYPLKTLFSSIYLKNKYILNTVDLWVRRNYSTNFYTILWRGGEVHFLSPPLNLILSNQPESVFATLFHSNAVSQRQSRVYPRST